MPHQFLRGRARLGRLVRSWRNPAAFREMSTLIPFYRGLWQSAAASLSAEFSELTEGLWRVSRDGVTTMINNHRVQIDDPVVLYIAGDKALCHRLLLAAKLPVPGHELFTLESFGKAEAFVERHRGFLFVVKPSRGMAGSRGITTHVRTTRECRRAAALASLYGRDLIIELLIAGESYRILVLEGRMIHATRRRGVRVVGDGAATIGALINRGSAGSGRPTTGDRDLEATLAAQGLTAASVPPAGCEVLVKGSPPVSARGTEMRTVFDEDATGLICPALAAEARRAALAVGSRFAGIDVITLDPGRPLREAGGAVNEVNTTPGMHHHHGLVNEAGASPAVAVLDYLLTTPRAAGLPGAAP